MKQVHREPHPFVGKDNLPSFIGKTIAFVGKVDRVEDSTLYMKTSDRKYPYQYHLLTIIFIFRILDKDNQV